MKEKQLVLGNKELGLLLDCAQAITFSGGIFPEINKVLEVVGKAEEYEIIHALAKGGHSEVFVVRGRLDGKIYALKKVLKQDILNDPLVNPVMRERDSMICGRGSSWLLGLHKSFQDAHSLYFLTDFIPGGDLGSLCCRRGVLSEEMICFFMGELLLALKELHGLGFVHRDIKPENVLIDADGHIKLADFGSSTRLTADDHDIVVGTPDYVAPELLNMSGGLCEKTDLWAVGVVVYELAFGITPFYHETLKETYSNIMGVKYTIGKCSEELKDLIEALLCFKEKRLDLAGAMNHPFFSRFDFTQGREGNKVLYVPSTQGAGSIENFEVEEFHPAESTPPTDMESVKKFIGFGYDPDILMKAPETETVEPEKERQKETEEESISKIFCASKEHINCKGPCLGKKSTHIIREETIKEEEITDIQAVKSEVFTIKGESKKVPAENSTEHTTAPNHTEHTPPTEHTTKPNQTDQTAQSDHTETIADEKRNSPEKEDRAYSIVDMSAEAQKELLVQIVRLEEDFHKGFIKLEEISVDRLKEKIEDIHTEIETYTQSVKESQKREAENAFQARWIIRKLQTEIRDAQSRIEREVETRTGLAEKLKEARADNTALKEQIRRLRLASNVYNFPVKVYVQNKWESRTLYLEEEHLRIKEICLPISKIYFQNLKKNELLRINTKGELLSFKLLLPSEDDSYTEHSESSSEHTLSPGEDLEIKNELAKEIKILEGIEKMIETASPFSNSIVPLALKQKEGTEKKIAELKQALAQGVSLDPAVVRYNNHSFRISHFKASAQTWCHVCNRLLYGEVKQGLLCKGCKLICHPECHTLVPYSCELQQAMEKGTSIILMAKQLEDKERIRAIVGNGQP